MTTYFYGDSEIQSGEVGFHTLVLMNPSYLQCRDNQFVGIHLPVSAALATSEKPNTNNTQSIHPHQEISALHGYTQRLNYKLWDTIDSNTTAHGTPRGLSLTLSSQLPSQGQGLEASGEDVRISYGTSSAVSGVTYGVSGMQSVLLNSKYFKAAQELLEEVGKDIKNGVLKKNINGDGKMIRESMTVVTGESLEVEDSKKLAAELMTVDRQEILIRKAKLISMLDEVEQRYRQYYHHMHMVISSFEQVAGINSSKIYTSLALEMISKQFRCLKDVISGQIRGACKNLGEEDTLGERIEGSRLKFVDHHLHQQQLRMIQQNAWRTQRGLPEKSVSVLREWLFEHFLHPYL